jgi:hypothetical protein
MFRAFSLSRVALAILVSAVAWGAPIQCTDGTLQSYIDLTATGGCYIGSSSLYTLFDNFDFSTVQSGTVTIPTTADITVNPSGTATNPTLGFTFNVQPAVYSPAPANLTIFIPYTAQAAPGYTFGDGTLGSTGWRSTRGGLSTVDMYVCTDGTIPDGGGNCAGGTQPAPFWVENNHYATPDPNSGAGNQSDTLTGVSLGVLNVFSVTTSTGGGNLQADIHSGLNSFNEVPEPVTLLLIGSGLLIVGLIQRRVAR